MDLMTAPMRWAELLSPERERPSRLARERRGCFDMDYDRIVYSSSLRRLQDKAQVFPLQENDFTRTRLTHSLETSALGRSLGYKAGCWIAAREEGLPDDFPGRLAALLQVAGLVHDLGNPPFGHYGEDLIRQWFLREKSGRLAGLSEEEFSDFQYFDGNAQTIRILARLQFLKDRHGINFCFGTLGALMKYPWTSSDARARERGKFGYFLSENDLGRRIIEATGLRGRHPATYLLEAADDLAYLFADLEDTVKKGHLSWEGLDEELVDDESLWADFQEARLALKRDVDQLKRQRVPREEFDSLAAHFFKITGQVLGIEAVCREFAGGYENIMTGTYRRLSLLEAEDIRPLIDRVRAVCRTYAYQNREVLSLELAAQSVVTGLLDRFMPALLSPEINDARGESGKLYRLISRNFEYIQKLDQHSVFHPEAELSPYQRVQLGIDFISGMTDSYALNLHKRLLGLALPG